jgi:HTH-type transcriptional regulator, competence development regulator
MNDGATLGQTVRALRKERGLSQRELAQLIDVDFTYVSKIENDRLDHSPSVRTLVRMAEALQVDELELMDLANKVPPAISAVARSPEALRFFLRAAEEIEDPSEWQALTDFLEARTGSRKKRRPK